MMGGALMNAGAAGQNMGGGMAPPPPPPAPGFAAPRWSLTVDGKTYGPYSDDAVKGMVASGQVAPGTLAWKPGAAGWAPRRRAFEELARRGRRGSGAAASSAAGPLTRPAAMSAVPTAADAAPAKVRRFPCAACGADVVWSPGAAALTCPYCGAKREIPRAAGQVLERPIEDALKARPTSAGASRARP